MKDIDRFCAEIPQGDDRVRRCLQEHKYDADMTPPCKEAVQEDSQDRAYHGALINVALCGKDMVEHTPECAAHTHANDKLKMIRCLIDNKDKITDPLCKSEIFHAEKEQASIGAPRRAPPGPTRLCPSCVSTHVPVRASHHSVRPTNEPKRMCHTTPPPPPPPPIPPTLELC